MDRVDPVGEWVSVREIVTKTQTVPVLSNASKDNSMHQSQVATMAETGETQLEPSNLRAGLMVAPQWVSVREIVITTTTARVTSVAFREMALPLFQAAAGKE